MICFLQRGAATWNENVTADRVRIVCTESSIQKLWSSSMRKEDLPPLQKQRSFLLITQQWGKLSVTLPSNPKGSLVHSFIFRSARSVAGLFLKFEKKKKRLGVNNRPDNYFRLPFFSHQSSPRNQSRSYRPVEFKEPAIAALKGRRQTSSAKRVVERTRLTRYLCIRIEKKKMKKKRY